MELLELLKQSATALLRYEQNISKKVALNVKSTEKLDLKGNLSNELSFIQPTST